MKRTKLNKRVLIYSGLVAICLLSLALLIFSAGDAERGGNPAPAKVRLTIVSLLLILSAGCLLLEYLSSASLERDLSQAVEQVERMARGQLVIEPDSRQWENLEPLAGALAELGATFRGVMAQLKSAYEPIFSRAGELSYAVERMSKGVKEQEVAAVKVVFFVEKMIAALLQNASNAVQVESAAEKASHDAEESRKAFLMVVEAMKQIAEKTSLIQEIARQTNLLALNINVEAVRADEQEKGFIGVAWEVGKLAIKTKKAAAEITKQAIANIKVAQIAVDKLKQLLPVIQNTEDLAREMCSVTNDKYIKTEQVYDARRHFDEVAMENIDTAEEITAVAQIFVTGLKQLRTTVEFFKIEETPKNQDILVTPVNPDSAG